MLRYQEIAPSPALAANVACFWAIAGAVDPGPPAMNRVLPDGCMDVIFDFAGVSRTGAAPGAGKVIAVGAMRRALVVEHQGRVDLFGVRFRPGGAVPLLKIPAFELTDLIAGLDHFWPEANRLADIIQAGPPAIEAGLADPDHGRGAFSSGRRGGPGSDPYRASEHARLRLRAARLEAVLLKKLDLAAPVDPLVRAAMRIIRLAHGDIPVRSLELRLGVVPRTLERRFLAAVGIPPKSACRVVRMQAAASMLRAKPAQSIASIAILTGFHDQAHFTRDFSRLAGITPAAWARQGVVGFLQDGNAPAA